MAETDFVPIYSGEQSFRPAYNARQGNAGFRAPGFIGSGTSSAQPQTPPVQGAQTSADATAALRGLYPSRADESGMGIGERSGGKGGINAGQQPTREADSLVDLGVSIAKGLGMMSGVTGLAGGLYGASQRDNTKGYTAQDLFGDGLVGRALASVFGSSQPPKEQAAAAPEPSGGGIGEVEGNPASEPGADRFGGTNENENSDMMSAGAAVDLGFGSPEPSQEFRTGGMIGAPGQNPRPIVVKAHTGEFVHRPEAVNKYGPSAMNAINALKADPAGIKRAAKVAPAKAAPNRKPGSAKSALSVLRAKPASRR